MSENLVAQAPGTRKRALIVNAFPAFERDVKKRMYRLTFFRQLAQYWRAKGVSCNLWERDIKVVSLTALNKYHYVIIATHGARYKYWAGRGRNRRQYEISAFCIKQRRSDYYNTKELKERQLVAVPDGYLVLPRYFTTHYKPGAFRRVVLAFESCSTFGGNNQLDTRLPAAFTQRDATAVAGFINILDAGYGRSFVMAFGDSLFEGKTVGASMTAAMSKVGKTQREYWRKITRARYPYKLDAYPGYVGKKGGRLT
jgi:hypothetical protein